MNMHVSNVCDLWVLDSWHLGPELPAKGFRIQTVESCEYKYFNLGVNSGARRAVVREMYVGIRDLFVIRYAYGSFFACEAVRLNCGSMENTIRVCVSIPTLQDSTCPNTCYG